MATTLSEYLTLESIGKDKWRSIYAPQRMGNAANIAYGGWTIAIAQNAAFQNLPSTHYLYSTQGNFLGPALTDRPYYLEVDTYRQSRSFITKGVKVSQKQDDGSLRSCMVIIADFQIEEKASMLEYSSIPLRKYSSRDDALSQDSVRSRLTKSGHITTQQAQAHAERFGLAARFVESRMCPEGIAAQNLHGDAKTVQTTQDEELMVNRTSADWFHSRHSLRTADQHMNTLAFLLDAGLAFMPLCHSRLSLDDSGPCSTLDFSLRILNPRINLNDWHLREVRTRAGGSGRTFTECNVWTESGVMVANMSQQSILRPKPVKAAL